MLESLRKASAWLGLSDLNQGGISCFLGLGGPPSMAVGVAPPIGMFPIGSGKECHLFSLGDCLGIGVEGVAVDGCSSAGESLVAEWVEVMGVLAPVGDDRR